MIMTHPQTPACRNAFQFSFISGQALRGRGLYVVPAEQDVEIIFVLRGRLHEVAGRADDDCIFIKSFWTDVLFNLF
jgi:hypothetical protein